MGVRVCACCKLLEPAGRSQLLRVQIFPQAPAGLNTLAPARVCICLCICLWQLSVHVCVHDGYRYMFAYANL